MEEKNVNCRMATFAVIASVLFLIGVFVFTNSWTVATSNHKKVLRESLMRYVIPVFTVQAAIVSGSLWFRNHGEEKLAFAGWILLLIIAFSPVIIGLLSVVYTLLFKRK
jgi:cytochrome bd-type quinol oxidase subunit 2